MRLAAIAFAVSSALALPSAAQDSSRGRDLAQAHCARCHAIAPGETSPAANAPAFDSFGRDWPVSDLAEALAEGIMVSHSDPPMPEFAFSPQEVDDLIAYLESVSQAAD